MCQTDKFYTRQTMRIHELCICNYVCSTCQGVRIWLLGRKQQQTIESSLMTSQRLSFRALLHLPSFSAIERGNLDIHNFAGQVNVTGSGFAQIDSSPTTSQYLSIQSFALSDTALLVSVEPDKPLHNYITQQAYSQLHRLCHQLKDKGLEDGATLTQGGAAAPPHVLICRLA